MKPTPRDLEKALAGAGRPPAELQSILTLKRTTYYDYLKVDLS